MNSKITIIASGSSVTQEDVNLTKGNTDVMVVSDNFKLAPWADYLYSCDYEWWKYYRKEWSTFKGKKYTVDKRAAREFNLNHVEGEHNNIINSSDKITYGHNSGTQAIGLAIKLGYKDIYLLGFDFKDDHWFGAHPHALRRPLYFKHCVDIIENSAESLYIDNIHIVNCSNNTTLTCFPLIPLKDLI